MNALTNHQIIEHNGEPAFVIIPIEEYKEFKRSIVTKDTIPHDIVMANALNDVPLIKAWREHLGLTQKEVAKKAKIEQSALARIEKPDSSPRTSTLKKLADAMGLTIEQIKE